MFVSLNAVLFRVCVARLAERLSHCFQVREKLIPQDFVMGAGCRRLFRSSALCPTFNEDSGVGQDDRSDFIVWLCPNSFRVNVQGLFQLRSEMESS